jgi:spore germination protein YaaH
MFDHVPVPPFPLPPLQILRGRGRSTFSRLLPIGLGIALAVSASLTAASAGKANAADPAADPSAQTSEPSIQYQEAMAHSAKTYSFAPGGPVTVPFKPRPGDTGLVDGAPPVALPAAHGSAAMAPDVAVPATVMPSATLNVLRREVLGFLPYWTLGSTLNYDTISTIAFFGTDLKMDGTLNTSSSGWAGWMSSKMTTVINDAHAHGTRVALTIEAFAWDSAGAAAQSAILTNPALSQAAAQNIAAAVRDRGADGVNLDFEPVASRSKFVDFTRLVRAELDKIHPGYELTFCATGAPGTYDLPNLLAPGAADAVFIMGYDLRGGSPTYTGSIDPLTSALTTYSLTKVVNTFISQVPASKVILGLPWYGHAWSTGGPQSCTACQAAYAPTMNGSTYGNPASGITYADSIDLAATIGNGVQYDAAEQTAWTLYYGRYGGTTDTWRQLYFDDARALSAKIDAIDGWNLRGLGIWALGYDNNNGNGDLTAAVAAKLLTPISPSTYTPIAPVRLVDTRTGNGLSGKLRANTPATFQVGGRGGVPSNATAVTGNVTAVKPTFYWALYLGPLPIASPPTSTVNFVSGEIAANGVTVALNATGGLSATYMSTVNNTTDLVFDVTGYFTADASGDTYHAISPGRLLDTRVNNGLSGKISANTPATFAVAGSGGVPSNATAVTGNVTVVNSSFSWAVYVGPDPVAAPTTSTINFNTGEIKANSLTVGLSATGTLSATFISNPGNTTDLVFDVTGYYTADATGSKFVPLTPSRLLDTRVGNGFSGKLAANAPRTFQVDGRGGVPLTATAVTGNVTVVNETFAWAVFVGPDPIAAPTTSTINFNKGDIKANGLTVALGLGGILSVTYMSTPGNTTDLVFDVTGYFVP